MSCTCNRDFKYIGTLIFNYKAPHSFFVRPYMILAMFNKRTDDLRQKLSKLIYHEQPNA